MPYLTVDEYQNSPSAVSATSLVTDGQFADQRAALMAVIGQASAWIDNLCQQSLLASTRTETLRINSSWYRDAELRLIPAAWSMPLQIERLWFGFYPSDLVEVTNLADVRVERGGIFAIPDFLWGGQSLVRVTYAAGFPNTLYRSTSGTTITVDDTTGMTVGQVLTIVDGSSTETVIVADVVDGTHVDLVSAPQNGHDDATAIHAMPGEVKQAAVLATSGFITGGRGSDAVVMQTIGANPAVVQADEPIRSANLRLAAQLLQQYIRSL